MVTKEKLKKEIDTLPNELLDLVDQSIQNLKLLKGYETKERINTLSIKSSIKKLLKNKKKILFSSIENPMEWQNKQRENW